LCGNVGQTASLSSANWQFALQFYDYALVGWRLGKLGISLTPNPCPLTPNYQQISSPIAQAIFPFNPPTTVDDTLQKGL